MGKRKRKKQRIEPVRPYAKPAEKGESAPIRLEKCDMDWKKCLRENLSAVDRMEWLTLLIKRKNKLNIDCDDHVPFSHYDVVAIAEDLPEILSEHVTQRIRGIVDG